MDAIRCDPMTGPNHDLQRHLVGIEFEVALEQALREMGTPFLDSY